MPPEQAEGKLEDVDERSDIYSLEAILYEMMTLTPPVGRGGDVMSVVVRVIEGKIDPPEKRAPERAREGWIPPELSAIAMKALAKKRKDRYQTVAALRRDIQLFQEGRSVSAKQDSTWEMFKKLVKRNKGASAGVAAALLVLLVSLGFIVYAYSELQSEQHARRVQGKYSAVPGGCPPFHRPNENRPCSGPGQRGPGL
jgi:serine/threonine protein kinase